MTGADDGHIKFSGGVDVIPFDFVQNLFPDKSKDYVLSVGESDIVLVREIPANYDMREIEKVASSIVDTFSTEFYTRVSIGIGTAVDNIKDLARSFKEAQVALEVGKVFDTEKNIISYDNLGIGRLIYQLPTTLCEMFLQEVFKKGEMKIWECRNCGHLVMGKEAPEVCPVCAHPQSYFEVRAENY